MTDRAQTIANIQVLRAIAALLVVFCHAVDTEVHARGIPVLWAAWIDDFGAIGVDLFFVISGFIIAHTAFGEHQYRAMDFLRRRIRRIVPLYFLLSLPWILRGLTLGPLEPDRVIATLLFWPASDATAASLPYLTVGWTLCFEMLFYLMAALVLAGPRHLPSMLILLHALCWLCAIATGLSAFFFLGNPIIYEFLLGVGIALATSRLTTAARWLGPLALLAGMAGFVVTLLADFSAVADVGVVQADPMVIQRVAMGGLPSAALVLGAVLMPPWRPNALFASCLSGRRVLFALPHPPAAPARPGNRLAMERHRSHAGYGRLHRHDSVACQWARGLSLPRAAAAWRHALPASGGSDSYPLSFRISFSTRLRLLSCPILPIRSLSTARKPGFCSGVSTVAVSSA
jgi:exopolysaccharide production protein ExoZ